MKETMAKHKQEMEKIQQTYDEEISDLKENNEVFVTQLRTKQVFTQYINIYYPRQMMNFRILYSNKR